MTDNWHLDEYQKLFEDTLVAALEDKDRSTININAAIGEALRGSLKHISDLLYSVLAKRSKSMLNEHRGRRKGFVKRNVERWRDGFDLLERLIVISEETGSAINNTLRPKAVKENDALFEALISNHARAVQVSREILTLMVAGFPDGALGRWRTLHEIAVITNFLSKSGKEIATRYIFHHHINAYKRAKNIMEHHKRANLDPIEPELMDRLKAAHDEVISNFHEGMKNDYGWAAPALHKSKPTFADLEVATGLDHWRPRYKWATISTHGAYLTLNSTLATCEAEEPVLVVGESNSGMTDPGAMTAISLNLATIPVINLEPNLDRLAIALVMQRLSDEIGETFWRLDRETLEKARGRKKRGNPG